jgi:hypothetical protein
MYRKLLRFPLIKMNPFSECSNSHPLRAEAINNEALLFADDLINRSRVSEEARSCCVLETTAVLVQFFSVIFI